MTYVQEMARKDVQCEGVVCSAAGIEAASFADARSDEVFFLDRRTRVALDAICCVASAALLRKLLIQGGERRKTGPEGRSEVKLRRKGSGYRMIWADYRGFLAFS